jgi:hypothetical protein
MVSSEKVYKAVLKELKHYNTTSMTPEEFNYHIWVAQLEYVENRYWAHEKHQKQIDDLDVIRIITDGIAGAPSPLPNEGADVAGEEYVSLPVDYLHLLAVGVKVKYMGDECNPDGSLSDYIAATPLKDDKRFVATTDYYSLPRPEWPNLYYSQRQKKLVFQAGQSIVQHVKLSYLRYPKRIVFDPSGTANVDSEFSEEQTKAIVKLCVQDYLETIESQRTQGFVAVNDRDFNQFPPPNVPT